MPDVCHRQIARFVAKGHSKANHQLQISALSLKGGYFESAKVPSFASDVWLWCTVWTNSNLAVYLKKIVINNPQLATMLHSVPLTECKQQLLAGQQKQVIISADSNFCLGSNNQTACYVSFPSFPSFLFLPLFLSLVRFVANLQGDSGSAVFELLNNRTVNVYGLTSWGNNSCTLGYPTVFTKLFHYRTLIHNITSFDHWLP